MSCKRLFLLATFSLCLGLISQTFGQPCVIPDDGSGTVSLPPNPCGYVSPSDLHMMIDGLPPGTTITVGAEHRKFFNIVQMPGGPLGGEVEQFNSFLFMQLNGTGVLTGFSRFMSLQLQCMTFTEPRPIGAPFQSFDTEMFQMQGQIIGDPDFDLLRVTAGNGFGLPSPGHTTLTQPGPGAPWAVDSFFDITYRIEFVGAPGGPLAGLSGITTGTVLMSTGSPVGPPNPVSNLTCATPAGVPPGTVLLNWINPPAPPVYDMIQIDVNGAATMFLPGAATSALVPGLAPGATRTICVTGFVAGVASPPTCCTVTIPGGGVCMVPNDGSGTVSLPPIGCSYLSPMDVHEIIAGLPAGTTIELGAEHAQFFNVVQMPGGVLGGEVEQFNSIVTLELQGTGSLSTFTRVVTMQLQCEAHSAPRMFGAPVQDFDTEMMAMQGQIIGDPDFDLLRITGGGIFGLPSPGHTTLTLSPTGGSWAVDSFFDITYEIEFVGAPGGLLGGMSGSTTATIRMTTGGPGSEPFFMRGDPNRDGSVNIGDAITILSALFSGGAAASCADSADVNDDGGVNIADAITVLSFLFSMGVPPPPPGGVCGPDPTADMLDCDSYRPCP
ncbi:MAG: dockerin type I domain-containing protein [Planctomycetota bacterium]